MQYISQTYVLLLFLFFVTIYFYLKTSSVKAIADTSQPDLVSFFSTLSPVELEHKAQTEQSILTPHKEQCHSNRRLFTVYDNKGAVELFLPFYRSAPFFHSSQSPVLIVIEMAAL